MNFELINLHSGQSWNFTTGNEFVGVPSALLMKAGLAVENLDAYNREAVAALTKNASTFWWAGIYLRTV